MPPLMLPRTSSPVSMGTGVGTSTRITSTVLLLFLWAALFQQASSSIPPSPQRVVVLGQRRKTASTYTDNDRHPNSPLWDTSPPSLNLTNLGTKTISCPRNSNVNSRRFLTEFRTSKTAISGLNPSGKYIDHHTYCPIARITPPHHQHINEPQLLGQFTFYSTICQSTPTQPPLIYPNTARHEAP
jgi:hypothetical protein